MSAFRLAIFFAINLLWMIINAWLSFNSWRSARIAAKLFAEKMSEAEGIHDQALGMMKLARLQEYHVCPTCQRIVQGFCPEHQAVPSMPN